MVNILNNYYIKCIETSTTYMLLMKAKTRNLRGKLFYIGLAFVELGSHKKEIGNTSVQNIIRVPGVTGNIDK
ncbi:hypothetical protein NQ315_002563 [Exocentrus adspersus]|uniref:Uncharacterized protein n=1 Tax=Exocentrus adspersus TaxID=1586481 RepID=A0AAV8V7U8_9CUCU|nr:hypothetical protein NQ315_002563 [Exocentrus adspersus]